MVRASFVLSLLFATGCGGTTTTSGPSSGAPDEDAGADAGVDSEVESDAPPPWMSGEVTLELVWAADVENHTAGWAGERFFGPTLALNGDVLVGGSLEGTWSLFGSDPFETLGNDIVAARLDGKTGEAAWTKHLSNDAFEFGVSTLGSGDTLLAHGSFRNTLHVGGDTTLTADPDPDIEDAYTHFFALYDGAGELRRASTLSYRKGTLFLPQVAWNHEGGVGIAALGSWAQVSLGGDVLEPVLGSIVVGRLDKEGEYVWSDQSIPETFSTLTGTDDVAVGDSGRLIVTGTHQGRSTLSGSVLDAGSAKASVVLVFEPDGSLAWHKLVVSAGEPPVLRVALAGDDVIVQGIGGGPIDFGAGPLGGEAATGFIARFAPDGALRWSRAFGGEGVGGMTVAAVGDADTYVAGRFWDRLDVGDQTLMSAGRNDAFVAKLDEVGQIVWVVRMGGEWDDGIDALTVGESGELTLRTGPLPWPGPGSGSIVISRWRVVMD